MSVVVVTYNSRRFLSRLIDALGRQSYRDFEVVFLDNASSDGSADLVAAEMPGATLIRSRLNLGYAGGNNAALERCRGSYIAILNPDTEPDTDWLGTLVAALDADPSVGLATSKIVCESDRGVINACGLDVHLAGFVTCRGLGEPSDAYAAPDDVAAVSGAAFVVRRELMERLGGFDEAFFTYVEDADLSWRALTLGARCRYVPESLVAHDYALRLSPRKTYYLERNRLQMIVKCYQARTLILLSPVLVLAELASWSYALIGGPSHVRAKAAALGWIVRNARDLIRRRRQVQAQRRLGDGVLLRSATVRLPIALVRPGLPARIVAACASLPFLLTRSAALALDGARWR